MRFQLPNGIQHETALFSNPFCTHWITPAKCVYQPRYDDEVRGLHEKFVDAGLRGQIIGPHGVGKSSLLWQLCESIKHAGMNPIWMKSNDVWPDLIPSTESNRETVWLIDSFESLSRRQQSRLIRFTKRNAIGLLVTCHRRVSLPVIVELEAELHHAIQAIMQLQSQFDHSFIDEEDVKELWSECNADLREVLMACYDKWQERSRTPANLIV